MILPDVNVLLYAFRRDSDDHSKYKDWLEDAVNADAAYGIAPQVLGAVVRISTHPTIYRQPSTSAEAFAFCNSLLAPPNATIIRPGDRHWSIFERLSRETRATGNLIQDAWFAALAIESGSEWISTDGDYARFDELRWRRPF
jgi:toxin-antitoxin system PIN domain toxin